MSLQAILNRLFFYRKKVIRLILFLLFFWMIYFVCSHLSSLPEPSKPTNCPKERKSIGTYTGPFPFYSSLNAPFCDYHLGEGFAVEYRKLGLVPYDENSPCREAIILDAKNLGHFPRIDRGGAKLYGGLPQNAALQNHREQLKRDVKHLIPEMDYNGIVAIRNLPWNPIWELNTGQKSVYVTETIKALPPSDLQDNSSFYRSLFEDAALSFLGVTLLEAKTLRPQAFWCYLGLPRCDGGECKGRLNRRLRKLWHVYDIFCPHIQYGSVKKPTHITVKEFLVRQLLDEALSLHINYIPLQVYAFVDLFTKDGGLIVLPDLRWALAQIACSGVNGVVLMGESSRMTAQHWCKSLAYLFGSLLHDLSALRENLESCSKAFCSKRGSCYLTNFAKIYAPNGSITAEDVDGCYDSPPARMKSLPEVKFSPG